jgi:SAM-dependent methyltransferase
VKPAEYRRMFEAEERQWWYAGQRAVALALFEPWARGRRLRLLDAGCGTGFNLRALSRHGATTGVDLSPDAIAFCRSRGVRAVRGSVLRLPFADASFDAVTSFDVIYHDWVEDDAAAVAEMSRVLRPGGALLVRVPALELLRGAHDAEVLTRRRYTLAELRALVERGGLRVHRSSYANSLLFPALLARRTLDRLLGREGSDVGFLPSPLERLFRGLMSVEAWLVRRGMRLPIGASAVVLGLKPAGAGPHPAYAALAPPG